MLDNGERLGRQFYKFRLEVCTPTTVQVPGGASVIQWEDKPDAEATVAGMISDIMIRHKFEDCVDIPENTRRYINVDLPASIRKAYNTLVKTAALETDKGSINAVHAGAKYQKILQLLTGAVYDEYGEPIKIHDERYRLVMDLVSEREKSIVAFNWRHEREQLCKLADSLGIKYGVIDGTIKDKNRDKVVDGFQNGELQVVFAQPQSAGHGLTFTKGTATIWCSPTSNPEWFKQFNRRIYRTGQKNKTETICICARDTREEDVYEKLDSRLTRVEDLLGLFVDLTNLKLSA
jgi:SNF2 family DNA or RNA helicase